MDQEASHEPVLRLTRLSMIAAFEAFLVVIMLSSSASWAVRGAILVGVSAFLLGLNAYWRDRGMPPESHL